MKSILLLLTVISLLILGCRTSRNTKTMIVASKQGNCQGVVEQACYLVKNKENQSWEFFYDEIKGFSYEEGYEYKIKVEIKKVKNPPQDASNMQYKLLKIISKEANSKKGMSLYNTWILSRFSYESNLNNSINKKSYITLTQGSDRFNGNGGCNRLFGNIIVNKDKITFKKIAATKMSCDNLNQEMKFINALEKVTDYKIVGCELFLYERNQKILVLESCR